MGRDAAQTEDGRYRLLVEAVTDYAIWVLILIVSHNLGLRASSRRGIGVRQIGPAEFSYSYAAPCGPALLVTQGRVEDGRGSLGPVANAPFPIPAHRTGRADLPHPALGQDFTPLLSRATPSAVSDHYSEFNRLPNLQVHHHVVHLS
jgi:hypothetical protein